ncbi:MAG: hypothetical protein WBQ94_20485 [Terracidiphilus sp.]
MRIRAISPTILTALLCASAIAQPNGPSFKELSAQAPELVQLQNEFEQTVPRGVTVRAKEVYRKGTSGKDLAVGYNIYVTGVPPGTAFRQAQFPVSSDKAVAGINGITLNKDGLMICAGRTATQCHNGSKVDDPVLFDEKQPLKGEPRRSVFLAPDLRIPITLLPDPVQSVDKGCRLSAIRLTSKFELAYIEGAGFPPNSDVHLRFSDDQDAGTSIVSDDGGVTMAHPGDTNLAIRSDGGGAIQTATLFNISRHPKGVETVEVTDPKCSPKVSYQWGAY